MIKCIRLYDQCNKGQDQFCFYVSEIDSIVEFRFTRIFDSLSHFIDKYNQKCIYEDVGEFDTEDHSLEKFKEAYYKAFEVKMIKCLRTECYFSFVIETTNIERYFTLITSGILLGKLRIFKNGILGNLRVFKNWNDFEKAFYDKIDPAIHNDEILCELKEAYDKSFEVKYDR